MRRDPILSNQNGILVESPCKLPKHGLVAIVSQHQCHSEAIGLANWATGPNLT